MLRLTKGLKTVCMLSRIHCRRKEAKKKAIITGTLNVQELLTEILFFKDDFTELPRKTQTFSLK